MTKKVNKTMIDVEKAKLHRPDIFDEQDIPDLSELNQTMQADLLKNAPDYIKELSWRGLKIS